jgi:hypothetical protein
MMTHQYLSGPSGVATLALALRPDLDLGSFNPGTIKCGSWQFSSSLVFCVLR